MLENKSSLECKYFASPPFIDVHPLCLQQLTKSPSNPDSSPYPLPP